MQWKRWKSLACHENTVRETTNCGIQALTRYQSGHPSFLFFCGNTEALWSQVCSVHQLNILSDVEAKVANQLKRATLFFSKALG